MSQPYYALRTLIKEKYGADKFMLGCGLVAKWLNTLPANFYNAGDISNICAIENIKGFAPFEIEEMELLRQLFGLQTIEELFTHTAKETTADHGP